MIRLHATIGILLMSAATQINDDEVANDLGIIMT